MAARIKERTKTGAAVHGMEMGRYGGEEKNVST